MITYCINTILCSALLFFFYKVLLENEKMHAFKRGYLLVSMVVSFIAPLITISFNEPQPYLPLNYIYNEQVDLITKQSAVVVEETYNKTAVLLTAIYFIGLAISLFKFMRIVFRIIRKADGTKSVPFHQARLVLVEDDILPHTFLNNIFINKETYTKQKIEKDILVHELAHVSQWHSVDILFSHLIQCVFWFNPVFILYLRAIQLNHEFLADEAVLQSSQNPLSYQNLLLQKSSEGKRYALTSSFNYLIIKKRLVMIAKHTSPKTQWLRTMAVVFMSLAMIFLFATKETIAQKTESTATSKAEALSTTEGASALEMAEYEKMTAKYPLTSPADPSLVSKEDKDRMFVIYTKMTKQQQEKQTIVFHPKPPVKAKKSVTQEQLKLWKDAKRYFVRIDGYKIDNSRLENHNASDFAYYDYYEPTKRATDYGKYEAQINLMTIEGYTKYAKSWNDSDPNQMWWRQKAK